MAKLVEKYIEIAAQKNPGEPEYIFTELGIGYRMVEDENTEM